MAKGWATVPLLQQLSSPAKARENEIEVSQLPTSER